MTAGNGPPHEPDVALAESLFAELAEQTRDARGVCRDSYGAGEQTAHDLVREAGEALGLEARVDHAGNLFLTIAGRDREAPAYIVGSHLDSVPQGGNYDGAAGVLAGLAVASGFRRAGAVPACDLTVMAIRAEEAAWFDAAYVGSRAAFGTLPPSALDAVARSDTGRSLAAHMREAGFDPDAVRRGERSLRAERIAGYLEVHIEQAPVLESAGVPVGLVTGIRGCRRFRNARCLGRTGHSGALPRAFRRDAVSATVALLHRLEAEWLRLEEAGEDLVLTFGELMTDPAQHGPSRVAGETRFVIDIRGLDDSCMRHMVEHAKHLAAEIGRARGVRFELGAESYSAPARLDAGLRAGLARAAVAAEIPALEMASGAGHDAAVFAEAGVPSAMLFIRNSGGSHNPEEDMDLADFTKACRVLTGLLYECLD